MAHTELDVRERRLIEDLLTAKAPVSTIAARLDRHRSTIYREIKRNRFEDDELPELTDYFGLLAQKTASQRRHRQRKLVRCTDILGAVLEGLDAGWSPEQIAGRMRRERQPRSVFHETIYACVYSPDGQSEELARYLSERRTRRQPRHARKPRGTVFPPDRAIQNRPEDVTTRETFGDLEGDLMIFQKDLGPANVASLVERKTRYAVLFRNNDRNSKMLMNRLITLFSPLPVTARRSITFDRGFEFVSWRDLKSGMGTEAWLCDPSAPWQKGSVENLNKRARRYLPRKLDPTTVSDHELKMICDRLNVTPRKCLGWRTPAEVIREKMLEQSA